ncbi:hypothetical protein [Leptospira noguchii]|uniref:hypothetical protein n=1 Tax=Leptospira noguchii TaxID=28182 RepID=UPI0002BE36F1|nr:hypothetical protein [Leptospira noguchii]EMO29050.1 hypothetical protein LEP1GSC170_5497 [Leptospira interrogans serovar Bataviae str. HAI135]UOG47602.1 hypothetical protein MAL00_10990 [Leptospira noguchii]
MPRLSIDRREGNSATLLSTDRSVRDRSGVNKLRSKGILCITIFSYNLLTEAESPVSEKLERSNNVEYNKTLKYENDLSPKAAPPLNVGTTT